MPQQYETYIKSLRKAVIALLLVYLVFTCVYLITGLTDISNEKAKLEEKHDLNLDPSQYDLAKMILFGSSFITFIIIALGLFAVFFKSFCIMLFFATTGTGIFILLIITMLLENVLSFPLGIFMVILSLATSSLSLYYAFEINRYKDYRPKLPNDVDFDATF